ncbi:MAG: AMP-binding protein [Verrucomicrobiota bacterium]
MTAAISFPDRAAIRSQQWNALQQLVRALVPSNAFYTRKIRQAGLEESIATPAEFSRLEFTTKPEIAKDQSDHPPYGSNLTFPIERYTRFHQTSGTTGAPIRWLDTPASWDWMVESWRKIFLAAGVTPYDRVLFTFSFGPFIGFWLAFEAAQRIGCLCLPGGGLSSSARLKLMIENEATVLCCTPTYALRLAEVARADGLDMSRLRLRTILVAGEPGGSVPATRARIESLWPRARIFDHHGMTETGPVTHECPNRPGRLHVIESAYLAEVLDPKTNEPTLPGHTGELILTTLGRIGSPLLRYRTGDLVRPGTDLTDTQPARPCDCGRFDLALDGGILGRVDDMIIVRGVNLFPSAVEDVIRSVAEIVEFQVVVTPSATGTELSVQIEAAPGCSQTSELARGLEKRFQDHFALRIPVTAVSSGTLPRFEMKAKRWIKKTGGKDI